MAGTKAANDTCSIGLEAQRKALRALAGGLHAYLGIPLEAPGANQVDPHQMLLLDYDTIKRDRDSSREAMPPGWWHHAEGKSNRWDHLGIDLAAELARVKQGVG